MEYRILGNSGFRVSTLSFGAWQIGDSQYWGEADEEDYERTVRAAIECGVNLFDTAEMYGKGESEIVLGRALGDLRDKVLIASKVLPEHAAPALLKKACEESLQRLNTDHIDLYQMHWPARDVPFADSFAAMDQLRQEGKIRAIGVSNFGPMDLNAWLAKGTAVSDQIGYNLAFRAPEYQILPACIQHGLGVLVYMPLLQGILSGRWTCLDQIPQLRRRTRHFAAGRPGVRHSEPGCEEQLFTLLSRLRQVSAEMEMAPATIALAWVLAQPGVTSAIIGARNSDQLRRNLTAADLKLPPDVLLRLHEMSAPVKSALGENADMWDAPTRIR
jgi:aryl-alcohol dehydrogenase-like predicted oxidoreductase